ncbi:MAG: hypothetical protein RLN72_13165 [Henriciella sp.]
MRLTIHHVAMLACAGLLAVSACSKKEAEAPDTSAEETVTDTSSATTPSNLRIRASMAASREDMCRSAFYDEENRLTLGDQFDFSAEWCDCFLKDIPISREMAEFDTLPRDGDYMADLDYALEEIARRRDFEELSHNDALEVLQTEAGEIENTELMLLLDAVSERATKTYADLLDESGACDRPK